MVDEENELRLVRYHLQEENFVAELHWNSNASCESWQIACINQGPTHAKYLLKYRVGIQNRLRIEA